MLFRLCDDQDQAVFVNPKYIAAIHSIKDLKTGIISVKLSMAGGQIAYYYDNRTPLLFLAELREFNQKYSNQN